MGVIAGVGVEKDEPEISNENALKMVNTIVFLFIEYSIPPFITINRPLVSNVDYFTRIIQTTVILTGRDA